MKMKEETIQKKQDEIIEQLENAQQGTGGALPGCLVGSPQHEEILFFEKKLCEFNKRHNL